MRYWRYCLELVKSRFDDAARRPAVRPRPHLPGGRPVDRRRRDGGLIYSQLTAGHETTSSLLAGGLKELLTQRERWEDICARPRARSRARVEEMLRISTPVFAWKRLRSSRRAVGDVDLPRGRRACCSCSARRTTTRRSFERPRGHRPAAARTPATTSPSASASTSASARRWRGWRRRSCSRSSPRGCPVCTSSTDQAFDYPPNTTFRAPQRAGGSRPASGHVARSTAAAARGRRGSSAARRRASAR